MSADRVPCKCCRGTGSVEFTGVYADTLALLHKHGKEVTGAELGREAGVKGEAMCNRLARLEELGFAKSRTYGRERLYLPKEA